MSLGNGLGQLKDQVFRISHLGDFSDLLIGTLGEVGLRAAESRTARGTGVWPAQAVTSACPRRSIHPQSRTGGDRRWPAFSSSTTMPRLLEAKLGAEYYQVAAHSGKDAIAAAFDVMPELDGYETCRRLRGRRQDAAHPGGDDHGAVRARRAAARRNRWGADDFLTKPMKRCWTNGGCAARRRGRWASAATGSPPSIRRGEWTISSPACWPCRTRWRARAS